MVVEDFERADDELEEGDGTGRGEVDEGLGAEEGLDDEIRAWQYDWPTALYSSKFEVSPWLGEELSSTQTVARSRQRSTLWESSRRRKVRTVELVPSGNN